MLPARMSELHSSIMPSEDCIVDASIADLSKALSEGRLTSVELVAKYLLRISAYDCRNTALNAVPIINENVFEEAAASDDRRAAGSHVTEHVIGSLEGIPFTVKDSYKVRGMTMASGSEAFLNLVADEDAFTVQVLREAGAVLVGRTNMCPMAYGGMLRGVYGRAESPYNPDYLAAAFGSGSSNGSGVSTAASFAAFGMAEETVSSGRSPASNNALVAYTPSRGVISIRGNWPLYPTCDVVVPHTRTVDDLFHILPALARKDPETRGDFWRDQPFIQLPPSPGKDGPLVAARDISYLKGKRLAVPQTYLAQQPCGPYVSDAIEPLWRQARADLEAAGASVEIVPDLPIMRVYKQMQGKATETQSGDDLDIPYLPEDWNSAERGPLIAHAWEDFLQHNNDPHIQSLAHVDPRKIFPHLPRDDPQVKFTEPANAVHWPKLASYVADRHSSRPDKSAIYDVPYLEDALRALEHARARFFEKWLSDHNYDFVVLPAAGDVARADADVNEESARHAWTDGVKYSHGERAFRHLGIPSVTVPMGLLGDSGMPMGLTFLGRAYDDVALLQAGFAYEQQSKKRAVPPLTPPLVSDKITPRNEQDLSCSSPFKSAADSEVGSVVSSTHPQRRPKLVITKCTSTPLPAHTGRGNGSNARVHVSIEGMIMIFASPLQSADKFNPIVEIYVDGQNVPARLSEATSFPSAFPSFSSTDTTSPAVVSFACEYSAPAPPEPDSRNRVVGKIARDSTMVLVIARNGESGRPSGYVKLLY